MKKTLVISDLHAPYMHRDALPFLVAVWDKYGCEQVISVGDEADGHALSYHEANPDLPSPGEELSQAAEFLQDLHKEFPKMRICESNHGSLLYRKALTHGIPKGMLKSYEQIYNTPGWTWHEEIIEQVRTRVDVCFRHSFGVNLATALPRQGGCCIVQGHHHAKANVEWLETPTVRLFGMTVGCLIDAKSMAFAYNRMQPARPMIGCGVIIAGWPAFIPMWLTASGRWTGKVS